MHTNIISISRHLIIACVYLIPTLALAYNSGVETTTKRYVIDETVSTVTYYPSPFVVVGETPEPPQIFSISGEFDATFSRYWLRHQVRSNSAQILDVNCVDFRNPTTNTATLPAPFEFPIDSFFDYSENYTDFSGPNSLVPDFPEYASSKCRVPVIPNSDTLSLIFELFNPPYPSLEGYVQDNRISFQGYLPLGDISSPHYEYSIQATEASQPVTTAEVDGVEIIGAPADCRFTQAEIKDRARGASGNPANIRFPHGLLAFTTSDQCGGSAITFSVTYPTIIPANAKYYKFGPTTDNPTPHWYDIPFTGAGTHTASFSITDGQLGDDDLTANGIIVDDGGLGIPTHAIPSLGYWAMLTLASLLAMIGMRRLNHNN